MNNCNAGINSITLAPDGRFYPCPAFYYERAYNKNMGLGGEYEAPFSIGQLKEGLNIKNQQLYGISHSPICRICDSFQCKRCIWLNRKMTGEINTPSHEQCVVSHLERNEARKILVETQKNGLFKKMKIKKINYLDPFYANDDWR